MRYQVEDEVFDTIDGVLDYCISEDYHEEDDYFADWVNEREDHAYICGRTYYAYDILSELDSDTLYQLNNDYCREMNEADYDEAYRVLNAASVGDQVECQYNVITVLDDEYEEVTEEEKENKLQMTRQFIEEQRLLVEDYNDQCRREEKDIMELFQVIGND